MSTKKPPFGATTVTLDARQFHAALSRAAGAVEANKAYPILRCVRLATDDDELEIMATDLDIEMRVRMEVIDGECPPICIETARLLPIASQLKDRDTIRLSFELNNAGYVACIVTAGRSRFTLETMEADQFPQFSTTNFEASFVLPGKQLTTLLNSLAVAISTEATRIYLNGIYLAPGGVVDPNRAGSLLAVATDGHKMFARHIDVPELDKSMTGIIVPRGSCARIAKLFADADKVEISTGPERVRLQAGATVFVTKLVEGHFPDWRRVMPKGEPTHSYDTAALLKSVEIAAAATSSGKNAKAVKLKLGETETEIEARDINSPGFTGSDACPHSVLIEGGASEIGVSAEYLAEALRSLDAETVEFAFHDAGAPILITGATFDDRRLVIMPMRV